MTVRMIIKSFVKPEVRTKFFTMLGSIAQLTLVLSIILERLAIPTLDFLSGTLLGFSILGNIAYFIANSRKNIIRVSMIERMKSRVKIIRPLLVPFVFYIGALIFSFNWLDANPEASLRVVVALIPMIPGVFIAIDIVHSIQQLDEMERVILLEGMAISFMATFALMISMGLLGAVGVQQLNGSYVALFMVVLWLIGKLWGHRRYQ